MIQVMISKPRIPSPTPRPIFHPLLLLRGGGALGGDVGVAGAVGAEGSVTGAATGEVGCAEARPIASTNMTITVGIRPKAILPMAIYVFPSITLSRVDLGSLRKRVAKVQSLVLRSEEIAMRKTSAVDKHEWGGAKNQGQRAKQSGGTLTVEETRRSRLKDRVEVLSSPSLRVFQAEVN